MSFAIFYDAEDLAAIAAQIQATLESNYDAFLTTQERNSIKQNFNRLWGNGFSGWATAQTAPLAKQEGDPNMKIVVYAGSQVTVAQLRADLTTLATKVPGASYMKAISDDLAGFSAAVEPWL